MLKYKQYIKESSEQDFKINDIVVYNSLRKSESSKYDGEICRIVNINLGTTSLYNPQTGHSLHVRGPYELETKNGEKFSASKNEIELFGSPSSDSKTTNSPNYIENQFKDVEKKDFYIGQRVIVNGVEGRITFDKRKGTVKRISQGECLIEFDLDPDSTSKSKFSMMIGKNIITPIDEPDVNVLRVGDIVVCIDKKSDLVGQKGEVTRIWPDGEGLVNFVDNVTGVKTSTNIRPEQVKIVEKNKSKSFTPPSTTSTDIPVNISDKTIEEEDDDDVVITKNATFKKKDLLEFSYKDFFVLEKISTKDDITKNKRKYEELLNNPNISEFKKSLFERNLRSSEIVEQYFDFLISKISNNLPVYRTVEQIDNEDLLTTKTKVRASESKEMTQKHSFDQGIIAYWKFKDAVVFKTL